MHDVKRERGDGTSHQLLECVLGFARLQGLGDDADDMRRGSCHPGRFGNQGSTSSESGIVDMNRNDNWLADSCSFVAFVASAVSACSCGGVAFKILFGIATVWNLFFVIVAIDRMFSKKEIKGRK